MRIDILVPVYIDTWNKGVWEEAQKTVSPDVDLRITNLEFGVPSLESMYDVAVASPYIVEKAIELEKDGSDGIIIYCMKEPALAAVKEKLGIPVIGLREATMGLIGVIGTVERPRNRGDGFCLVHEKPAAVEGGTADSGEYRVVQRTLRGIRVHAETDIAA